MPKITIETVEGEVTVTKFRRKFFMQHDQPEYKNMIKVETYIDIDDQGAVVVTFIDRSLYVNPFINLPGLLDEIIIQKVKEKLESSNG